MSFFAGAFSLDRKQPLSPQLCADLRRHLSRHPGEPIAQVDSGAFFLVKGDVGAFAVPALLQDAAGNVSAVAGEPLMRGGESAPDWNRARDLALLQRQLGASNWDALAQSRGTFCGVHYEQERHLLLLFVDKVGVRPLYVWHDEHVVVFSTALRVLEALPQVGKTFDVRGVTEIATFGYPLGTRTAYSGIRMLAGAEVTRCVDGAVSHHNYWDWQAASPEEGGAQAVEECHGAFMDALRRRQRRSPGATCFLSGGLDSRAIVGGLALIVGELHTVNFAPDNTQDQVFATLVAEKLNTRHAQLVTNGDNVGQGYRKDALALWMKERFGAGSAGLIWSGDGGSVALGHVYLTRPILQAMRRGDRREAVALFNKGLPGRIIQPAMRKALTALPFQGAEEELAAIASDDPGRAFHLFLLQNDQRRHLVQHFEDLDLERIEFQLPFFDADFLATILCRQCEPYMQHRFYIEWLRAFPNGLATLPWQAYPGHVPCDVAAPAGLKYQWEDYFDSGTVRQMQRNTAARGKRVLGNRSFPRHLISRSTLSAAVWMTRLGVRDYAYLINTAYVYDKYWSMCDGGAKRTPGA